MKDVTYLGPGRQLVIAGKILRPGETARVPNAIAERAAETRSIHVTVADVPEKPKTDKGSDGKTAPAAETPPEGGNESPIPPDEGDNS